MLAIFCLSANSAQEPDSQGESLICLTKFTRPHLDWGDLYVFPEITTKKAGSWEDIDPQREIEVWLPERGQDSGQAKAVHVFRF